MQLPTLLTAIAAACSLVLASPIERRQAACSTNGQWVCSGLALQQCAYGNGGTLTLSTIQTCSSGQVCSATSSFVGCTTGTAPAVTTSTTAAAVVTSTAAVPKTTAATTAAVKTTAPASGSGCYAAFVSGTAYNGGAQVSFNGVNYLAKWWEAGTVTPDQPGDGGWSSQGPCGTAASKTTQTSAAQIPSTTADTTAVAQTSASTPAATTANTTPLVPSTSAAITTTAALTTSKAATTTAAAPPTTTTAVTPPPVAGNYTNQIVTYWGAHPTAGELPLATYCNLNVYTIIQLSFITGLNPVSFDTDITQRPNQNMAAIAADILHCQSLGIRVGISIGGAVGSVGLGVGKGAPIAQDIWNNFLGGSTPLANRVLPGVILDGIDIDVESNDGANNAGYAELTNSLRALIVASGKPYYISAAPQCPIPDANMDYTLKNGWFDFVSVQFYSALCGIGFSGPQQGPNYADNSSVWNHGAGSWMTQTTLWPNKNVKLVVGFPANGNAGNFGASDPMASVQANVPGWKALNPSIFGGLMWWDAFWMGLTAPASYKTFLNSLPN
ncbi:Chitinase 1 [Podochytrium sp. JEL0797]|nr:Chitinase 1 [Podochytrium sp. JEL0797]